MKKSIKFLSICLLAAGMSACSAKPGDSQSDSANETPDSSVAIAQEQAIQDSINQAVQDSIAKAEEAANAEKADIQTIKTLYAKCVLLDFDKGPDDNYGKAHVTPAMLKN